MIDAAKNVKKPAPANRDQHDLLGKIFDSYASEEGRQIVEFHEEVLGNDAKWVEGPPPVPNEDDDEDEQEPGNANVAVIRRECPKYMLQISSDEFGGVIQKPDSPVFKHNHGTYVVSLLNRLTELDKPKEADGTAAIKKAEEIANKLIWHLGVEHSQEQSGASINVRNALETLKTKINEAGKDNAARVVAYWNFANVIAREEAVALQMLRMAFDDIELQELLDQPSTFASAITDVLFDSFMTLAYALGSDSGTLITDATNIVNTELGGNISANLPKYFALPTIVEKLQQDARNIGGDNSYKINIGI